MRRLAHKIHATVLFVLILFGLLAGITWHALGGKDESRFAMGALSLMAQRIPATDAPPDSIRRALRELAERMASPVGLWTAEGELIYRTLPVVQLMPSALEAAGDGASVDGDPAVLAGKTHTEGTRLTAAKRLTDGRWLVVVHRDRRRGLAQILGMLAILAAAIGLGALPLTRRLTRRLERLRSGVEELGAGGLSARVPVEGRDEVAELARSFNAAAARIEHLVDTQRNTLASASHELRSPLARLRLALELLTGENGARGTAPGPGGAAPADAEALRRRVAADIAELDSLIDEILLATRLEALSELEARDDDVDLLALAAEEGARVDADVSGQVVVVRANERLLRRLVRNLADNAARHGDAASVRLRVSANPGGACLEVCDAGPGVPEAERERVFEPFYRPAGLTESGRGYGLGLALVRRIARLHGGDVLCVDAASGGVCFRVMLPLD